jgi:hypothetical protein
VSTVSAVLAPITRKGNMRKPIVKRFWCEVYHVNVLLVANCDLDEYKKVLKCRRFDISTYSFHEEAVGEVAEWSNTFVIYIQDKRCLTTIVHEALHLAMMITGKAGCDVGTRCSEHEHVAYYQSFWFDKIRKAIK